MCAASTGFGGTAFGTQPSTGGGLFGASSGNTTGGLFGQQPTNTFGQQPQSASFSQLILSLVIIVIIKITNI